MSSHQSVTGTFTARQQVSGQFVLRPVTIVICIWLRPFLEMFR